MCDSVVFLFSNSSQSAFVPPNTSSNDSSELSESVYKSSREFELEEIFVSRRNKIQEICEKYKMKNGQGSSEIFQSILCFHKYEV